MGPPVNGRFLQRLWKVQWPQGRWRINRNRACRVVTAVPQIARAAVQTQELGSRARVRSQEGFQRRLG